MFSLGSTYKEAVYVLECRLFNGTNAPYWDKVLNQNKTALRNALQILSELEMRDGTGQWLTIDKLYTLLSNLAEGRSIIRSYTEMTSSRRMKKSDGDDLPAWFLNTYLAPHSEFFENVEYLRYELRKIIEDNDDC